MRLAFYQMGKNFSLLQIVLGMLDFMNVDNQESPVSQVLVKVKRMNISVSFRPGSRYNGAYSLAFLPVRHQPNHRPSDPNEGYQNYTASPSAWPTWPTEGWESSTLKKAAWVRASIFYGQRVNDRFGDT